jgi:hypothetical protein
VFEDVLISIIFLDFRRPLPFILIQNQRVLIIESNSINQSINQFTVLNNKLYCGSGAQEYKSFQPLHNADEPLFSDFDHCSRFEAVDIN